MTIVERTYKETDLPDTARSYARDTVTLGWEDRVQTHGRRRSDGGLEFGLALPRGIALGAGDCLVLDDDRTVVAVVEQPQPVFLIEPDTPSQWALYAYHIGNRHQPLMITERAIVCPDIAGVEQLLHQQHIPYARAVHPFTPVSGAPSHHH